MKIKRRELCTILLDLTVILIYLGPCLAAVAVSFALQGLTQWIVLGLGFMWPVGVCVVGLYQGCD
ncbi:hypothetical protein Pan44_37450 [Caulifigura coniformis]|uniref:Uncharacterized protein n=1 Tax=Caulifigura coniformis TaxID=2527983 RepID=A0A517SFA8_9PLAN|nr:hypothetical protein Pan44_28260 [Caulifigura coniformis]QDT55699.1 hypothetical protein Pan44_37450 [Caulifigura coniformis]